MLGQGHYRVVTGKFFAMLSFVQATDRIGVSFKGHPMSKILLVEDDAGLGPRIAEYLTLQHHKVEIANTGTDADELLRVASFELLILDWDLPGLPGIEVLKRFRSNGGQTPVLMLTGKDELTDIEAGLDGGADDYLVKPFAMRELAARVRALTRKSSGTYSATLKIGSLEVDSNAHRVTKGGAELKLQPQEFALLEFLLKHPSEVFSIEALQQRLWSSDSNASPDSVRVCITRLRNKIDEAEGKSYIRTVHRLGYQIETDYESQ